jgi:hypothetical protein
MRSMVEGAYESAKIDEELAAVLRGAGPLRLASLATSPAGRGRSPLQSFP